MDRRKFTSLMATAAALGAEGAKADTTNLRAQLIGCWSLQDAVTITDGKVTPWEGRKLPLTGMLFYHSNGWVSTQISGARPLVETPPAFNHLSGEERLELLGAYYAYYGTYEVDETARTVTHKLVDALWPYEKGKSLRRSFVLEGDVLRLTTAPLPTDDGRTTYFNRLTWKKIA